MSEQGGGDRDGEAAGALLVIVGPSGAGKDTLIDGLRLRFADDARVRFVQRTVTRMADPNAEAHASMTVADFEAAQQAGAFSVTWDANGLKYGLPADVADHLASGGLAVANGSRQALPAIRAAFARVIVVAVTVAEAELARRLAARGRETAEEIRARLQRARDLKVSGDDVLYLDNSGPPEVATARLCRVVEDALQP
ncbi:MAG: phosphonate metabolism protein/1,5-bisphosphokinase (PRPP-forming) PhnN [Minwuia sp.]|nr:phosphonate metabolism protein/1,5-bisphosphokinase (PRPP-forming) PhnN [Minwuia sp.]